MCSDCGSALISAPPEAEGRADAGREADETGPAAAERAELEGALGGDGATEAEPEDLDPWTIAEHGLSLDEGYIARSILEAEGIEVELGGVSPMRPLLGIGAGGGRVTLFVHASDVERARAILAAADAEAAKTPPDPEA